MNKKLKTILASALLLSFMVIPANAQEVNTKLTNEQKKVIEQFKSNKTMEVNSNLSTSLNKSSIKSLGATTGGTKRATFKRGSALAWVTDIITYDYYNGGIESSEGEQDGGYIFPNTIKLNGLTKYKSNASTHYYRGKKSIGAGIITKWGDLEVHTQAVTDYYRVTGEGKSYWDNK